jgi:kumamolisin
MESMMPGENNQHKRGLFIKRPIAFVPIIGLTLTLAVLISYFAGFNPIGNASANAIQPLAGIQPQLTQSSQIGNAVDPSTPVTIAIGLQIHNQADLDQYVKDISSSANKEQRTLTQAQIIQDFSPYPAEQQAVIDYMHQYGFVTSETFNHRLVVGFTGTMGQAEQAFNVSVNNYTDKNGQQFYAPSAEPSVPTKIAPYITTIEGLDDVAHYTHEPITPVTAKKTLTPAATAQATVSCPANGTNGAYPTYYAPSQISSAYNLSSLQQTYKGNGQTLALVEFANDKPADIAAYTKCYGGASVPTTNIAISGGATTNDGTTEADLDIELALSTAPQLGGLRIYDAPNTDQGSILMWSQIVSDAVPVVSTSWGLCEADVTPSIATQENALFAIAAAQGQSILAASGDDGSIGCLSSDDSTALNADDPAAQPYVTAVGGTTLRTTTSGAYSSETTWNNTQTYDSLDGSEQRGSGGGISTIWPMPAYQQSEANTLSSGIPCGNTAGDCREVPDVSFSGDPDAGYPIYTVMCTTAGVCQSPNWYQIGGTSTAAPMFASLIALANQYSLSQGYYDLGFLNPLLYSLDQSKPGDFHDITTGNNSLVGGSQYAASSGYDMATGLGTPASGSLFTDLANLAGTITGQRSTPATTTWYFAEGDVGDGYQEFLSILNPSITQTATLNVSYLFSNGQAPVVKQHTVAASSRGTISTMADLNLPDTGKAYASISVIVQSVANSNGVIVPIVAERPMYFNFGNRIYSGSDVMGATDANQTSFYFPLGDTRTNGSTQIYNTFITMLNPSTTTTANITATYYANGQVIGTQTKALAPMQRGTLTPPANKQMAMKVTSDIGIVAERPLYFQDNIPNAGGQISGAATTVGATSLGTDWLFAEGSIHTDDQENLVLANFTAADTTAQVNIEYTNGQVQTVSELVKAYSQSILNINSIAAQFSQSTTSLSIAVHDPDGAIVAERQIFFTFTSTANGVTKSMSGVSDTIGDESASGHSSYSFSEGYTAGNNSEFLTLQNPSTATVHAALTIYADGTIIQKTIALAPHSRTTVSINAIVVPLATAYPINGGSNVSLTVQGLDGKIVAERVYYFLSDNVKHGGTAMLGYTNN